MVTLRHISIRVLLSGITLLLWLDIHAQTSASPCVAEELNLRQNIDSFLDLSAHTCIYVDKTAALSFDEVLLAWEQGAFMPLSEYRWEGVFQRGKYTYWLRFSVRNVTDALLQPAFYCGQKTSLDLFDLTRDAHKPRTAGRMGRIDPYRDSLVFPGKFLLHFPLPPDSVKVFMLRIQSVPGFSLDVVPLLYNQTWLAKKNMDSLFPYYLTTGTFFGFLMFALLFALIQYVQRKDNAYLYYSLYVLGLVALYTRTIAVRDPVYNFFPKDLYQSFYHAPITVFVYIFNLLFISAFLNARHTSPPLHRFIQWAVKGFLFFFVLERIVFPFDQWWSWKMLLVVKAIFLMASLYILFLVWKTPNRLYRYILAGEGFLVFSVLVTVVLSVGISERFIGYWQIADIPSYFGIFFEILCFTLGLAYKSSLMEKEKTNVEASLRLEQANTAHLQELDDLKTRLYTNITHEFRTPLTVISGMADQIGESPKRWLVEGVQMIKRNANHLLRLVNQLLDLRKLEAGKMSLHLVQGDVLAYLKYLVESFHSHADAKNIDLHFKTVLPELVMDYDPDKLQQIVSNLLSNALKFTPSGGAVVVTLEESSRQIKRPLPHEIAGRPSSYLMLAVKDTGLGISPEKQSYIFDLFYQADDSHTRPSEGTGIGLALTKELVKLFGGEISVTSEPGKGAEFVVALPVWKTAAKARGKHPVDLVPAPPSEITSYVQLENQEVLEPLATSGNHSNSSSHHPLILIMEDNPDVVQYLYACLASDFQLLKARNGREGIAKAIESVPDLIISDVMMPEKDGFEVCETLKNDERTSHIPIILLTAKADVESRLEGLKRGADAYLAKPFNKNELLIRVQKLLELRQKLQQHYLSRTSGQAGLTAMAQQSDEAGKEDVFVQKVKSIIEKHLSDSHFSTVELSHAVAMSRSQLHRKLTALTGLSPNPFIRLLRLEKAREMLADTDMAIAGIAYSTGFNDPDYFARIFSKAYGFTPSDFRELAKNKL